MTCNLCARSVHAEAPFRGRAGRARANLNRSRTRASTERPTLKPDFLFAFEHVRPLADSHMRGCASLDVPFLERVP